MSAILETEAVHDLATSPDSVFAVPPVSSRGPFSSVQLSPGPVTPMPPPRTRLPAGHWTVAPTGTTLLSSTENAFVAIVASEPAEQRAKTRYGVRASTETTQERATSPDSVDSSWPLSLTGALRLALKNNGRVGPVAPMPPPTARVPAGQ